MGMYHGRKEFYSHIYNHSKINIDVIHYHWITS